jgi:hypothetical protein
VEQGNPSPLARGNFAGTKGMQSPGAPRMMSAENVATYGFASMMMPDRPSGNEEYARLYVTVSSGTGQIGCLF